MPTNNSWNSQDPAQVSKGGTGLQSVTAYNVVCGGITGTAALQPVGSLGTSGQVLTSAGAGALPTWTTGGTGSGWVLLSTATASASATIDFTTGIDGTYTRYAIQYYNVYPATDSTLFYMRTSADGGSTYDSAAGSYEVGTPGMVAGTSSDTEIMLNTTDGNTSSKGSSGVVFIVNPSNTTFFKTMTLETLAQRATAAAPAWNYRVAGAIRTSTAIINAVRFYYSSGNITAGIFRLYGVLT